MTITLFEKEFLGIKDNFNPFVIRFFHTLLQKVESDPYRKWTHDLLRNYVNATYELCISINKNISQTLDKQVINFGCDDDTDLQFFFTGLYTPKTYQGFKNGLYFVGNPSKGFSVMTRKEIFETDKFKGKQVLRQINHRDSFENELVGNENLFMKEITPPKIIKPKDACKIINLLNGNIKKITEILQRIDKKEPFEEILKNNETQNFINDFVKENKDIDSSNESQIIDTLKRYEDKIKGNSWLHILRDGIDNLPTDFVISFFNKWYEVPNPVDRYSNRKRWIEECVTNSSKKDGCKSFQYFQEIMIETMNRMHDNIHNLPVIFHKKYRTYNYLLPMYLLNSGKPDFCIVLRHIKDKDGNYTGNWEPVTSLDMDEVYCDIRVFGKDAIERGRDWW